MSYSMAHSNKEFLEETVYPTLLPGLEKLLKGIKRAQENDTEFTSDPLIWIAQVSFCMKMHSLIFKRLIDDDMCVYSI